MSWILRYYSITHCDELTLAFLDKFYYEFMVNYNCDEDECHVLVIENGL